MYGEAASYQSVAIEYELYMEELNKKKEKKDDDYSWRYELIDYPEE